MQWLSVLLFCSAYQNKSQNRFLQVPTGEGKTTIFMLWAALLALHNQAVDIITSSSELALRDSKLSENFYSLLDLTVSCNIDSTYKRGAKSCYSCNIVYGDTTFAFDLLRDEFSLLNTRQGREYRISLFDEVDHQLIDGLDTVTMISEYFPGMDSFKLVFIAIWRRLSALNIKNGYNQRDKTQQELIQYVNTLSPITTSPAEDTEYATVPVQLPQHLINFFNQQKYIWVESALQAYYDMHVDHQYNVRQENLTKKIIPINQHIGIFEDNTTWCGGLMQFLQIKEGCPITPLGLSTNFLSIIALVNRYQYAFGLTATLGSTSGGQQLMHAICNSETDFISIPASKPKQLYRLPEIIVNTDEQWHEAICYSAILEAYNGRVSLVICNSVAMAKFIHEKIKVEKFFKGHLYLYAENTEINRQLIENEFEEFTIIITTNLSGRGTNIKLAPNVVDKGRLHLCLIDIPSSLRAQEQLEGRVARNGQLGTIQTIIHWHHAQENFSLIESRTLSAIIRARNQQEETEVKFAIADKLPVIKDRDKLFNNFCTLFKEVHVINQTQAGLLNVGNLSEKILGKSSRLTEWLIAKEVYYKDISVKEAWGLWLEANSICHQNTINTNNNEISFEEFKENILTKAKNGDISINENARGLINNSHFYLQLGNHLLARDLPGLNYAMFFNKKAIECYEKAIALDPNNFLAYYYSAAAVLKNMQYSLLTRVAIDTGDHATNFLKSINAAQLISSTFNDETGYTYKQKAVDNLTIAAELISEKIIPPCQTALMFLNDGNKSDKSYLIEQIKQEESILQQLLSEINKFLMDIKQSQKSLDLKIIDGKKRRYFTNLNRDQVKSLSATKEQQAQVKKSFCLTMHGLSSHKDVVKHYQIINSMPMLDKATLLVTNKQKLPLPEWLKTLINLLPENRYGKLSKLIAGDKENQLIDKATSEKLASEQPPKEKVDNYTTNIGKVSEKAKKQILQSLTYVEKAASKAKKGVSYCGRLATEIGHEANDILWDYSLAEIPVDIEIENLDTKSYSILVALLSSATEKKDYCFTLHILFKTSGIAEQLKSEIKTKNPSLLLTEVLNHNIYLHEENSTSPACTTRNYEHKQSDNNGVKIKNITLQSLIIIAKTLADMQDNCIIKISINKITQKDCAVLFKKLLGGFKEDASILLKFSRIRHEELVRIVWLIDSKYPHYQLKTLPTTQEKMMAVLDNADRAQQHFTVKLPNLSEGLARLNLSNNFKHTCQQMGLFCFYHINENKPIPWISIQLVSMLAVLQIGGGIALVVATEGIGSSIGADMIMQGAFDIFKVLSMAYNRESLDIVNYTLEKTFAYSMSLMTAGIAKGIHAGHLAKLAKSGSKITEADTAILAANKLIRALKIAESALKSTAEVGKISTALAAEQVIVAGIASHKSLIEKQVKLEIRQRLQSRSSWLTILRRVVATDLLLKRNSSNSFQTMLQREFDHNISNTNGLFDIKCIDSRFFDKLELKIDNTLKNVEERLLNIKDVFNLIVKQNNISISADSVKVFCDQLKKHNFIINNKLVNIENLKILALFNDKSKEHQSIRISAKMLFQCCEEYHSHFSKQSPYQSQINNVIDVLSGAIIKVLSNSFSDLFSTTINSLQTISNVAMTAASSAMSFGLVSTLGFTQPKLISIYLATTTKVALPIALFLFHELMQGKEKNLKHQFDNCIYEIKQLQWKLDNANYDNALEIKAQYVKLIKLSLVILIQKNSRIEQDSLSLTELLLKANEWFEILDKELASLCSPNGLDITKAIVTLGISDIPGTLADAIAGLFSEKNKWSNSMNPEQQLTSPTLLPSLSNELSQDNLIQVANTGVGEISKSIASVHLAKTNPGFYIGAEVISCFGTVVKGTFSYLDKAQDNERLMTQMIGRFACEVANVSREVSLSITKAGEQKRKFLDKIKNECNQLISEKTTEIMTQIEKIREAQAKQLDDIKGLLTTKPESYVKLYKVIMNENRQAVNLLLQTLSDITAKANENAKNAYETSQILFGKEVDFYNNCLEFYGNLLGKAQDTLEKLREANDSLVKTAIESASGVAGKLIEGTSSVANTLISNTANLINDKKNKEKEQTDEFFSPPIISLQSPKELPQNDSKNLFDNIFETSQDKAGRKKIKIIRANLRDLEKAIDEILADHQSMVGSDGSCSKNGQDKIVKLTFSNSKSNARQFGCLIEDLKDVITKAEENNLLQATV